MESGLLFHQFFDHGENNYPLPVLLSEETSESFVEISKSLPNKLKAFIRSAKNDQLHTILAEHPEFWTSNLGLLGVVSPSNYRGVNPQSFSPLAFFFPKFFFLKFWLIFG